MSDIIVIGDIFTIPRTGLICVREGYNIVNHREVVTWIIQGAAKHDCFC
jgi:hypothetical protein